MHLDGSKMSSVAKEFRQFLMSGRSNSARYQEFLDRAAREYDPARAHGVCQYLPRGKSRIIPQGFDFSIEVLVDEASLIALEATRNLILARGGRPHLNFLHDPKTPAAFFIKEFFWVGLSGRAGIWCFGRFTDRGLLFTQAGIYPYVSATHAIDRRKSPFVTKVNPEAEDCMGSFCHYSAHKMLPVWNF